MAKYDVKMSCGHVETIQLFGKNTDRQKKIAWLEEHGVCSACYKARKDAEHAAETAAATAKASEENLPALTGSEKQINWALSIRAKKFADLDKMLADANVKTTDEQMRRQNQIAHQAARNVLASKTESRFWIDNRNVEARRLIADNNLQDDLKAEFARLTAAEETKQDAPEAQAEIEVETEEYAITTAAMQVATEAEENAAKKYRENQTRNLTESIANIDIKNIALKSPDWVETSLRGWMLSVHDKNDKFVIFAEKAQTRGIFIALATYDTVAQVETVINMLKAAIDRGDSEFIFPTVEELTTPDPEDNNNGNNGNNDDGNDDDGNGNGNNDNANEEIINCTDDIIITEDAYTQMIRTELANAQIASGNYGIQINGEWIYFNDHKITRIDAEDKLGFSFEYTLQGRKQFRHNGRVISRDSVIKFFENKETAKEQEKSFREFFINPDAPKHGFFQVMISPTFVDGCEHNYGRYFEYYADAIDFVNNAIEFCGDVPTHITIKRNKQAGKVYYHRMPDGTVHIDKPDTDFFKNYSATEIKTRIDAINRTIKENTDYIETINPYRNSYNLTTRQFIRRANDQLAVSKNFYEFVLHETVPVTIAETDGSEEDDFTDELPALIPAENNEDDELVDPPEIEFDENIFIGQDGTNYIIRAKKLNITVEDRKIKINGHIVAKYKTDAGVAAAFKYVTDWSNNIANYKTFDINDYNTVFDDFDFAGGNEDKFVYIDDEPAPTDKVITPDEMLATLDAVNAAAPYGWQIDYNGKNFPVKFNRKIVATLDSLALAKVLPPDKFFDQFNPDVPPKEQYINDRRKELDQLLDFCKFVEDDPDRLNTLANLIEDVKREILDAELDTEHPPDAEHPPDSAG